MAGGHQRDLDAVALDRLAVAHGFCRAGEILAIARGHDREGLRRRHHRAVAGARVVGMAVGDHRARHRPHRIDVEIARRAIEPGRGGTENAFRFGHAP